MVELLPGENAEYLLALGRFTQRFAVAETSLDVANTVIFNWAEGAREINPEVPNALTQKTTFFRKAHEKLLCLENLRERSEAISEQFISLKEPRHFLIHGIADADAEYTITKLRLKKSMLDEQKTKIPIARVVALGDEAWLLAEATMAHSMLLVRALLSDDQIDEAFGGLV